MTFRGPQPRKTWKESLATLTLHKEFSDIAGWTCLDLKQYQNLKKFALLQYRILIVLFHMQCTSPKQC